MAPHSFVRIHRKTSGFTLVIMVIGIIGFHGVMTLLGLRFIIAKTHQFTCTGNLLRFGVVIQGFTANTGRYPIPQDDSVKWDSMTLPFLADFPADFAESQSNTVLREIREDLSIGIVSKITWGEWESKASSPHKLLN